MSILGAMFSGVSGLNANSQALGAIADNITNINTKGRIITIKDESDGAEINNILIDTEGSETIDGGSRTAAGSGTWTGMPRRIFNGKKPRPTSGRFLRKRRAVTRQA